ncbi:MAG: hypothetical protein V9G10_16080 [Candidatus Nanopelagicales bacterium]
MPGEQLTPDQALGPDLEHSARLRVESQERHVHDLAGIVAHCPEQHVRIEHPVEHHRDFALAALGTLLLVDKVVHAPQPGSEPGRPAVVVQQGDRTAGEPVVGTVLVPQPHDRGFLSLRQLFPPVEPLPVSDDLRDVVGVHEVEEARAEHLLGFPAKHVGAVPADPDHLPLLICDVGEVGQVISQNLQNTLGQRRSDTLGHTGENATAERLLGR